MRTHVSGAEVDHISARGPPANSAFTISIAFICTYVIFALAVTPFAGNPGPEISGITALFRAYPHWSLLILGSAFLYSALMVVPHLLTFPGAVLADQTLVGSSRHAPGYIFVLWIAGFALLTFVSVVF